MKNILYIITLAALFLAGCATKSASLLEPTAAIPKKKKPKNIILMIADGTGLSQISSGLFYGSKKLNYERFKNIGLIKTSASDNLVTDSAAGATAFACGIKTYNGAIAVNDDKQPVPTILEALAGQGKAVGVVATSTITHATPGSFYAHVPYRKMEEEIAEAMITSPVTFFAGGGRRFFNEREDSRNFIQILERKGFDIETESLNPNMPVDATKSYGFLLAEGGMPKAIEGRGDFLKNASLLGIKHLSLDKDGFFLMIEGSQVDWGGHANDADYLIGELLDFDKTLGHVLDWAEKDGETLVIVTADHETGGFTLAAGENSEGESDYNTLKPSFSTGGHSATMVPVFATGPGAEYFRGIYENTEIYHKMKALTQN